MTEPQDPGRQPGGPPDADDAPDAAAPDAAAPEGSTASSPEPERRSGLGRRRSQRRQHRSSSVVERRSGLDRRAPDERRQADRVNADSLSLGRRLRQRRTILSLLVPIILLVLVFRVALNIDVGELIAGIRQANPLLLLAAFVVFYAGFPLRGMRWALLLRGTGFRIGLRDATEILFLSWLVNCLVPAKLGDVYRAYLLKLNSPV